MIRHYLPRAIALLLAGALSACATPASATGPKPEQSVASHDLASTPSAALAGNCIVRLAGASDGRRLLGVVDDFVRSLSAFDRQARLGLFEAVDSRRFLEHVRAQILEWDRSSERRVLRAVRMVNDQLRRARLELPWPTKIQIVHTTGNEEIPGAPYTRGTTIVLPQGFLEQNTDSLAPILAHELFHVLSRANPQLRDKLYAVLGFSAVAPVALPPTMVDRRLTNPDAPVIEHAITVSIGGARQRAVPVMYARKNYDPSENSDIASYIVAKLAFIDDAGDIVTDASSGLARVMDYDEAHEFFEQVGRNTDYVIHPEEIVAENFRLLLSATGNWDSQRLESPEISARIRDALATWAPSN